MKFLEEGIHLATGRAVANLFVELCHQKGGVTNPLVSRAKAFVAEVDDGVLLELCGLQEDAQF